MLKKFPVGIAACAFLLAGLGCNGDDGAGDAGGGDAAPDGEDVLPEEDTAPDAEATPPDDAAAEADAPGEADAPAEADARPDADVPAEAETGPECGNGVVEGGEECDDANDVTGDGCEADCRFTCADHAACDDALACNGSEACDPGSHVCAAGTAAVDGTACSESSVVDGVCRAGRCVAAGCGNGIVEPGEDCDDGNAVSDDGCENDCRFTCASDGACSDGNPCNGYETCDRTDPAAPVCAPGTDFVCTPADPCHVSSCDPAAVDPSAPCVESRIDADGDGESPTSLGACGTDCNDSDPAVRSGAVEICGNRVDDDCNPATLDTATTAYYQDCDGDGFAADTSGSVVACSMPTTAPCGGASGWTAVRPTDISNTDCHDRNAGVSPAQTSFFTTSYAPIAGGAASFDYNCNLTTTGSDTQYAALRSAACEMTARTCPRPPCALDLYCAGTSGWSSTVPACGVGGTYATCPAVPAVCRWDGTVQTGCTLVCDPTSAGCCLPGSTGCSVDGRTAGTFCTPGALGCAITCTPNTRSCTWQYLGCSFSNAARTQGCR